MRAGFSKTGISWVLLSAYFFAVCFGDFFRVGDKESAVGLSTALAAVLIAVNLSKFPGRLLSDGLLLAFVALFVWSAIASIFSEGEALDALKRSIVFFGYICLSASVATMTIDKSYISYFIYFSAAGLFFASLITVMDYFGIYDFQGVNENQISTKIRGVETEQAGGFFARRSAMAAYYSVLIPFVFICSAMMGNKVSKTFCWSAAALGFLALFLTHNRSGILSVLLAIPLFYYLDKSINFTKWFGSMMVLGIFAALAMYIVSLFLPEHMNVYVDKLGRLLPGEQQYISASDYSRWEFFEHAIQSLATHPAGHGFGRMYSESYHRFMSPHNIITYVIYSVGLFSFIWFFVVFKAVLMRMKICRTARFFDHQLYYFGHGVSAGVFGWLLNNMAHNSFSTGVFWVFIGFLISLSRYTRTYFLRASPTKQVAHG